VMPPRWMRERLRRANAPKSLMMRMPLCYKVGMLLKKEYAAM
jgi:hypothetical protein